MKISVILSLMSLTLLGCANDDTEYDLDGDGYSENDCNDNDSSVYPGALERCNNIDDNCDGIADDGYELTVWYLDNDYDTYAVSTDLSVSILACLMPYGYAPAYPIDCDDTNPAVYPGSEEVCNGFDDDCDNVIDEGCF